MRRLIAVSQSRLTAGIFRQERKIKQVQLLLAAVTLLARPVVADAPAPFKVDPGLPVYHRVAGVSGNLSSIGSDTLANVMTFWGEAFNRYYPNVNIQVQASGSSTAPPALTEGTSNFGPMSRKMKSNEVAAFEQRYGYPPTAVPVAIDALAVYVHKDNPISGLSLRQLDAIFSNTRKCGGSLDISTWGQLGLDSAAWSRRGFQLFGRNSVSGTYGYFKQRALCKGDFKNSVNEQPGSASVVQSVATAIAGIGYSGSGYLTASVRAVPLGEPGNYVAATPGNAISGDYPLSRYLYLYVNKPPQESLPPLQREFLKLVLSRTGQQLVVKDAYIPLPGNIVEQQLRLLDILR